MRQWDEFDKFAPVIDKYMPISGEGDTMASQICTAVNKLVYKWYNDGDVFDNNYALDGWANDLSSYANWLYKNVYRTEEILDAVMDCENESDYEELLYELCDYALDEEFLAKYAKLDKVGSIYTCEGPYKFIEIYDDEEEEYW